MRLAFNNLRNLVLATYVCISSKINFHAFMLSNDTRWFKYDRDDLCVNKSQFVPVIFEPPCILYFYYGETVSSSRFTLITNAAVRDTAVPHSDVRDGYLGPS
jgi:hypothetical protein